MRIHVSHVATALLVASLGVACSRDNKAEKDQTAAKRASHERVRLRGCVERSNIAGEYVLRRVSVPAPEEQPQGQDTMEHRLTVPAGSWVRLNATEDVKSNLGKRVEIWGEVVDTGQNTLGTSGRTPAGQAEPQKSTVPPATAMANGLAPKIAVEKVSKLEEPCEAGR